MAISKIGSNAVDTLSSKLTLTAADGVEDNDYIMELTNAEATDGRSYGLRVKAGSTSADQSFVIQDHDASNTLLKVTGDGAVTQPLQPSIAMDGDGSNTVSFSGSNKIITEWTSFHTVGITYNSSNGRFTVPSAGKYFIHVNIYLYQNDAFQRLHILDNDSIFVHSTADYNSGAGDLGQDNSLVCTAIRDLSANDYITFSMLDGGGRIHMAGAHSHCTIHKLG